MGLACGAFHPPGGNGKESAPPINGACAVISLIKSMSTHLLFIISVSMHSLAKNGGIATAVLLVVSSIF